MSSIDDAYLYALLSPNGMSFYMNQLVDQNMAGTVRCCQGHVFVIRTIALSLTVIQISLMVHNIILIEASTTEFRKVAGKLSSHIAHRMSISHLNRFTCILMLYGKICRPVMRNLLYVQQDIH